MASIVLLSGGMDSATVLAGASRSAAPVVAITFDYGQTHRIEIEAARALARAYSVESHLEISLNLGSIVTSALTGQTRVPRHPSASAIPPRPDVTYVPARNTLFLAYALAVAEERGIGEIFFGATKADRDGFPDCREEFFRAFEATANLALKAAVEDDLTLHIRTPLLDLTKADVLRRGLELGVDFSLTRTCYDPDPSGRACGSCASCRRRLEAFAEVGAEDPIEYQGR